MDTKTTTLVAALFLGLGCSHATPKPQPVATALSPSPHTAPPTRRQPVESAPPPQARIDTAGEAIYFDFDSDNLRQDARPTLQQVGDELKHTQKSVRIEGNCDERGTTEYNIALGDKRAWTAKHYLERLGIPGRRISIVSYGSERPRNPAHNESAWAQNRRDDFKIQ